MKYRKGKKYPCPVCCRLFCRDRDMILIDGNYVCESVFWDENLACDFSFPEGLMEEGGINEKAAEHIAKIGERALRSL